MNRCILNKTKFIINADGALKIRAKGLKAAVKRFYVERSALCLAGSQKAVEYFKCYGAEDKKIIRHPFTSLYESDILSEPVSRQEKEILREKYGLPNKVTLIAAGQFIVRKGFDLLLQAWDDAYDAQLYLVGGGGKRAEYEDYLRRHNITNVEIIDFLPREQLFDYYRMSDVFLMPTREDIWGLVVNEAMAKGLPVISSDRCTAGNELIRNGENGFIYPVEDTAKLRELMRKLIDQPELRLELSENALLAIRDHTYENVIRSHCDVIEQILDT